jgi:hypothetical protein
MKFLSPLISEARKSQGAQTWSKNRAGNYTKAKPIPAQPRTDKQQARRAEFTAGSQAWRGLTDTQRAAWQALANQIVLTDSLGQTSVPSGHQLWMRCYLNLATASATINPAAPLTPPSIPSTTGVTIDATAAGTGSDLGKINVASLDENADFGWCIRATAAYSAGKTFVSQSRYRVLSAGEPGDSIPSNTDLGTAYATIFGPLTAGSKMSFQVLYVDVSGIAGAVSQSTTIVGAHVTLAAAAKIAPAAEPGEAKK